VGGDRTAPRRRSEDEGTRRRRELVVYEFIAAESSSRWQRQPSYARSSLFRLTAEIFRIEISWGRETAQGATSLASGTFTLAFVSPQRCFTKDTHSPALVRH